MTARAGLLYPLGVLLLASFMFACAKEPTLVPPPELSPVPIGWLDAPQAGPVSGRTPLQAWALTHVGTIAKAEFVLDGAPLDVRLERGASGWACGKCPRCEECANARYLAEFDFSGIPSGEHWLSWRVTTSSGHVAEIGRRKIVVR